VNEYLLQIEATDKKPPEGAAARKVTIRFKVEPKKDSK
jgi:hypothetical protein